MNNGCKGAGNVAASIVLLVSAGLLIRSFIHLQNAEIGFDAKNLFSVQLSMPRAKYQTPTSRELFAEQLLERIRSSPGVATATQVLSAPPNGVTFIGGGGFEIRGGGNATRQIVDILPPCFPADRLMICEVFTPGGNWSSYPPHKHDEDNPPVEADLDETYYFRIRRPEGYAFQRLYRRDGSFDQTFMVLDGVVP